MISMLKKMLKTGVVTKDNPFKAPPPNYRGKILVTEDKCDGCQTCVEVCPSQAISFSEGALTFDYGKCMYCGICVDHCPTEALEQSNQIKQSVRDKRDLKESFSISALISVAEEDRKHEEQ